MSTERKPQLTVVTSLRLTPKEHRKLKRLARRDRRSLSDQMRQMIDEADERKAA